MLYLRVFLNFLEFAIVWRSLPRYSLAPKDMALRYHIYISPFGVVSAQSLRRVLQTLYPRVLRCKSMFIEKISFCGGSVDVLWII